MKKKLLYGLMLPLLAVMLVSAGAVYYVMFSADFNINNLDGMGYSEDIIQGDFEFGDVIVGETRTITNDLENDRNILITTTSGDENIGVEYKSTLELTKKVVEFGVTPWDLRGEKVQIEYTIVGDKFSAEVIEGDEVIDYVLIYYADAEDRFVNPEKAILIGDVEGNLPNVGDANAYLNDYSEEYTTSYGAKIWYVPLGAINGDNTLNWSRADEFYFESKLIQYNSDGEITFYSGDSLDIIPEYTPNEFAEGSYTIETIIA